jgi:3-hydroxyisobutyrate dehydrogenase
MTQIGFIGLGSQGAPMARCIVESGYPLLLWARRAEALAPFADTPAETASSIADLGARSEHVGVCVVDDAGVEQVCGELIPAMRPGGRIAIHSTVHPDTVVALAKRADARKLALIDAPVSGGGPGAGQMAKLVNNALMAAHVAMAHHALGAGSALGLDRTALREIVKVSSGRSYGFEVYARLPSPSAFGHGARLLAKDVRLLGEVLGEDPSFAAFRDVAEPFLDFVQQGLAES